MKYKPEETRSFRLALPCFLLTAGLCLWLSSPARAQHEIRYYDRAKKAETTVRGRIVGETPSHLVYRLGSGRMERTEKIPATDIIDVEYDQATGRLSLDYRKPGIPEDRARQAIQEGREEEGRALAEQALEEYRALLPRLGEYKFPQRHAQFRMTQLLAWLAELDPSRLDEAITELQRFQKEHPDAWQTVASSRTLARLLEQKGDLPGAQAVYEALAARDDVPKEVRQQSELQISQMLIENDRHADAEARLKQLGQSLPPDDPQALRVQVYLADCQAAAGNLPEAIQRLQDLVGRVEQNDVLALAHNTLGDCYRRQGGAENLEKAFWEYLWVEVLYNQDRQQHARALYHLSRLFQEVKQDAVRAEQCRNRLASDRRFAGLELQKRARQEAKERGEDE